VKEAAPSSAKEEFHQGNKPIRVREM
jgi:hypothetical protein